MTQGRLLFVHAHPDDETIGTGIAMARAVDRGQLVTLVTCTLGEEGEVLVPELANLAAEFDDALGPHRAGELAEAMSILGVTDHRRLGGDGRFRDSGMMGTPANDRPQSFWQADLIEAAALMVSVIRETRPHVLVTYDDFGGYGHPDHIQAHRAAMYGMQLAAAPSFRPELGEPWDVPKAYWTAFPRSMVDDARRRMAELGVDALPPEEPEDGTPWACPDEWITTRVVDLELEPRKQEALRAHRTQITDDAPFFQLSRVLGPHALGVEHYRLVKGALGPLGADGREDDLLAGLDLN